MANFAAQRNYVLVSGTDYTPGAGTIPANKSYILAIHVVGALGSAVTITHPNGTTTTIPAAGLAAGAIYDYPVKSITLAGGDINKIIGLSPEYKVEIF